MGRREAEAAKKELQQQRGEMAAMEVELETVKERERELVSALHGSKGRGSGARRARAKQSRATGTGAAGKSAVGAIEKAMEAEKKQRSGKGNQGRGGNPDAPGVSSLRVKPDQKQKQ